jgi:hypothetical protein
MGGKSFDSMDFGAILKGTLSSELFGRPPLNTLLYHYFNGSR